MESVVWQGTKSFKFDSNNGHGEKSNERSIYQVDAFTENHFKETRLRWLF
jgi:hypothetical protein